MKFVLFSDLHLDAAFAWTGTASRAARNRRESLRQCLRRILDLAKTVRADAVLCGGDLYEHDRFSPDTEAFLKSSFADIDPIRIFIAPGNHDWYGPTSIYHTVRWSSNVHVFSTDRLAPITLCNGLTLWGAAHCAPAGTPNFLQGFRVDRDGVHIGLFHGSESNSLFEQEEGKSPHAPFDLAEIERAGLRHAFLGHYHSPRDGEWHTYPGNPEPLSFGEAGERGPVVVTVSPDGAITRDRYRVALTELHDLTVNVTGCTNRQEVRERVDQATSGLLGLARIILTGDLAVEVDLRPQDFCEAHPSLEALTVKAGSVRVEYDFQAIAKEPTVRGQFVSDVLRSDLSDQERRRVLITGLRALDGRDDLEVF